jgi:hypothetical protein
LSQKSLNPGVDYRPARLLTCPIARPVVSNPKTKNGCAEAWYLTSLAMGSGMKYLKVADQEVET